MLFHFQSYTIILYFKGIGDCVEKKNIKKNNHNKKVSVDKVTPDVVKRLNSIKIIAALLLLILIGRLFWIEIIQGAEYKEMAYKHQTINRIISPKRGTIYDSTGKALAVSSRVDTVTINPRKNFIF